MASEVTLPALGESVTEGTVTRWLKQVGDSVAVDEPLLEVSTDKVDTEIPSPVAGTLLEIKANEDDTVEVGAVLGVIGEEGESAGDADETAEPEAQPKDDEESEKKAEQEEEVAEETGDLPDGDSTPESEKDDAPAEEEPAAEKAADDSSGSSGGSGGSGTAVTLPALGESVTEGTVTRWLKKVGDEVAVDEPLLEVSTDKVDTEIPSPVAGTLLEIKAEEDETVEVGAELAIIGSGDAAPAQDAPADSQDSEEEPAADEEGTEKDERRDSPAAEEADAQAREDAPAEEPKAEEKPAQEEKPAEEKPAEKPAQEEKPAEPAAEEASTEPSGGRDQSTYVTPLVRKMADQNGVDLSSLTGTGVGGRIRKQDVLDAAAAAKAPRSRARRGGTCCRRTRGCCCPGSRRYAVAPAWDHRAALATAQGHREADGRVAHRVGPAHAGHGGRRHVDRPDARGGQGRLPGT